MLSAATTWPAFIPEMGIAAPRPLPKPITPISNRHLKKLECDVTSTKQTPIEFLIGHRCTFLQTWGSESSLRNSSPTTLQCARSIRVSANASALAIGLRRAIAAVPKSIPPRSTWRTAPQPTVASVTAGQRSVLTGQLLTLESEPVATQLIISNRSVPRLETHLTPTPATKHLVLIDTNSDTKFRPATPPAPQKTTRKIACRAGCVPAIKLSRNRNTPSHTSHAARSKVAQRRLAPPLLGSIDLGWGAA
jgi:hypothetical protein